MTGGILEFLRIGSKDTTVTFLGTSGNTQPQMRTEGMKVREVDLSSLSREKGEGREWTKT